jgi:aspartate racemase
MTAPRRIAGVLGGMGPAATIDFMAKVLACSQAARGPGSVEQDDVRLLVDSNPGVPDRNAAVAGTGPSPGPVLAAMAQGLERAGADFLVMPCNAAHAFADHIIGATPLPFVHIIDETVRAVRAGYPAIRTVGVLAVAATAERRLYENAFERDGIVAVVPEGTARDHFMQIVWHIKGGDTGAEVRAAMRAVAEALVARGAELIVAGCTEVPLVLDAGDLDVPFVDATLVLAERTVAYARGEALPQR